MHTRASNSKLVEPLPEPERTLNRRLRRRNRKVSFEQRNNPPQHPRIIYPPILDINYFRHFLDILRNYDPMDDEPMWAADRVVALTPGSAIIIPETANEFAIKDDYLFLLSKDEVKLTTFLEKLKLIKDEVKVDVLNPPSRNTGDVIGGIFLISKPKQVDVQNPTKSRNKREFERKGT
ncbi:hypothetical protein Tco_0086034 [Tanacetum coccineum]